MTTGGSRPLFISLEGIDGSGKSTQARALAAHLGPDTVLTREPGGSDGAEEIRQLLLTGDPDRWSAETEILLFTAARRDHLERTIRPALNVGHAVVTDRFADSTRVYQGATRGDLRGLVDQLHDTMIGTEPDLTFIVDMDPQKALARGLARLAGHRGTPSATTPRPEDRFETFGLPFQTLLRDGFLALAADHPDRCIVIDGDRAENVVAGDIAARIDAHRMSPQTA